MEKLNLTLDEVKEKFYNKKGEIEEDDETIIYTLFGKENVLKIIDIEDVLPDYFGYYILHIQSGYLLFGINSGGGVSEIGMMNVRLANELKDKLENYKGKIQEYKRIAEEAEKSIEGIDLLIQSQRLRLLMEK